MMAKETGEIITFYSYKGGTGRSMTLANVACLLALRHISKDGRGVLMVDWDLEAPGLHRFFRKNFNELYASKGDYQTILDLEPGLIDLFIELDEATRNLESEGIEQTEEVANTLIDQSRPEQFVLKTDIPSLSLLKAGRFDDKYAGRVNTFKWEQLYNRSPWLIHSFARYLSQKYRYVLIDSRTGITDISGICTMLMPEKLVAVFTPNRQSLFGLEDLIRQATQYRGQSDDLRPLAIFPLASRIEPTEPDLRNFWRFGEEQRDIPGYQPMFEKLFKTVYELSECDLNDYFKEVQVQHMPFYSYGENIAVLHEDDPDRLSLPISYDTVVKRLVNSPVPWEYRDTLESKVKTIELNKRAEEAYSRLSSLQQELAPRVFSRLVRLAPKGEGGEDTRQRVSINEFNLEERAVAKDLAKVGLLTIEEDDPNRKEKTVEPAKEALIHEWTRLRNWIAEDRDFLLQRQSLRADLLKWQESHNHNDALLTGNSLVRAKRMLDKRAGSLNPQEKNYIDKSEAFENSRRVKRWLRVAAFIVVSFIAVAAIYNFRRWREQSNMTASVYLNLGDSLQERNEYTEAIKNYDQAIKLNPKFAEAYYKRGTAYEKKGDVKNAIESYNRATENNPDYTEAYNRLGLIYYLEGDYDLAILNFNRTIELDPRHADAYLNRGNTYLYGKNQLDQAIADYTKAVEINSGSAEAYDNMGVAFASRGDYDKAIENYTKAIELKPEVASSYYHRGQSYQAKDYLTAALTDYNHAIYLDHNFAEAYLKRGNLYFSFGETRKVRSRFEQAISDYNQALELNPRLVEAYFKRGRINELQRQYENAIDDYSKAIILQDGYADAYIHRGLAYQATGKHDEAIDDFTKVIELQPNSAEAYYNRGVSYKARNKRGEAIADFQQALQSSDDANLQQNARFALKQLGIWNRTPVYNATVSLHYENLSDKELMDFIKTSLEAKGYFVTLIPPKGNKVEKGIRYFNEEDKQNAEDIQSTLADILKSKKIDLTLRAAFFGKYRVNVGQIEVWIPSLTQNVSPAPVPGASSKEGGQQ